MAFERSRETPCPRERQQPPRKGGKPSEASSHMLVCHCNLITQREIEQTIIGLLDADPWQLIVPAKVYHALAKRGRCCGCFPNVVETIIRVTEEYHARSEAADTEIVLHLDRVRELRGQFGSRRYEGRKTSHRAA